jgi:hypothetical protein
VGSPAPISLIAWPIKTVILLAFTFALIVFFLAPILEIITALKELPPEPADHINFFMLLPRVTEAWTASGFGQPVDIANRIYDRLQSGDLKCWGRKSSGFPDKLTRPWPARRFITPAFWKKNTIEDLDYWLDHQTRHRVGTPENTVTKPTRQWRPRRATHYYDLAFDRTDANRLWPGQSRI